MRIPTGTGINKVQQWDLTPSVQMSLTLKHTVLSVCQLEKKQAKNKTETQL